MALCSEADALSPAPSWRKAYGARGPLSLDPRTKLLLIAVEAVLVLASAGGERLVLFRIAFTVLPFLLLLTARQVFTCVAGLVALGACMVLEFAVMPQVSGMLALMILVVVNIVARFIPAFMMGKYVIETTTVSEFKAAMERMHMPDALTIPMCVMFRFFPTVGEEWASIRSAMKMRGIGLGGGKASAMLEYRVVPMIACSAIIGEELSASALTRGLGKQRRTNICRIGFGAFDMVATAFVVVAVLWWLVGVFGVA